MATPTITTTASAVLHPRPNTFTLALSQLQTQTHPQAQNPGVEPEPSPPLTPPSTPSILHPALDTDAIHLFYLRVKHLGTGYAAEIASSAHTSQTMQLRRFFDEGMRVYVLELEDRLEDTLRCGLGFRILMDAVLRGRTPGVGWLASRGVGEEEIRHRKVLVSGLEDWVEKQKTTYRRRVDAYRKRKAVWEVEVRTEVRRGDAMRKWWVLRGLRGEQLRWREHCWDVDLEVERSGWKSLEEEFREVGEWPDGCVSEGEDVEDSGGEEWDEASGSGMVEEAEESRSREERDDGDGCENGWVVVRSE